MSISPFRIPLHVHPSFLFLVAAITWLNAHTVPQAIIWVVIIFISVLIHEYGHALTALVFRQRAAIDLVIYGGVTRRTGKPLSNLQEFILVFNGPLASFLLSGLAYFILKNFEPQLSTFSIYALQMTWTINLFWTILNLLPVSPLDGGQLLSITLQSLFGLPGLRFALLFSTVFAGLLVFFFFAASAPIAAILFMFLAAESYQNWMASRSMTVRDQNPTLQHQIQIAQNLIQEEDLEHAEKILNTILASTNNGLIHQSAIKELTDIYLKQGRYQAAYNLLQPIARKLQGKELETLVIVSLHCNDLETASKYGNQAYREFPSYGIAVVNARTQARLNQAVPAIGWLQSAIRDGLPNIQEIVNLSDFDSIKHTTAWQSFQQKNLFNH